MADVERVPELEGLWRRRTPDDKSAVDRTKKRGRGRPKGTSEYMVEYLGSTYTPDEFRKKYCPEWKLKKMLHCRASNYSPAESIVRYNALYSAVYEPEVPYTYKDLDRLTRKPPTRKVRIEKVLRDRAKHPRLRSSRTLIV